MIMDSLTIWYIAYWVLQSPTCNPMDLIYYLRMLMEQIHNGMLGQEFQQTNNHNNFQYFQSGPQNGPTSNPFGSYAQLSPPYSPGSIGYLSSVAASPALQQSSSIYVGDYHGGSNLPHGPFHSGIGVYPTSTLAARVSPSTSQQSDLLDLSTSLNTERVRSTPRVNRRRIGKTIRCPYENCDFVTGFKHHLKYHMDRHTGIKPFRCGLCLYSCINKAMLKSHMKLHATTYQYHCADCQTKDNFYHTFKKHLVATGHRQGKTFDEYGNPSKKIIDVHGKRRGLKKPAQIETKICAATVVSPPETPHYYLSPVQVASLDLRFDIFYKM